MSTTVKRTLPVLVFLFLGGFIFIPELTETVLRALFPQESVVIYPRTRLNVLLIEHLSLVLISSLAAICVGISLGIAVTRPIGRDFLGIVRDIASLAQTFPPVAVLALAVPALGFGFRPAVAALALYSVLPVLQNTISGIESVPPEVVEASCGMGMTRRQVLLWTELPLAARVIAAGVRTSVVINVGTATIGAVVAAGGLGTVIVSGLVRNNVAFVFTGAITSAGLALGLDWILGLIENLFYSPEVTGAGSRR